MGKKVLIAIPSNTGRDTFPVPTSISMMEAVREIPSHYTVKIHYFGGLRIDAVRNTMVLYAQKKQFDVLIMLDDDMIFPSPALKRLLELHETGIPVVSGLYTAKSHPFQAFIYPVNQEKGKTWLTKWESNKLYDVKAIATGCICIDMKVFDVLPKPYFLLRMDQWGRLTCTEDCYFGMQCFKLGIRMVVDTSVECQHLKLCAFPSMMDHPQLHYEGEWRTKRAPEGLAEMKGPMIIHPVPVLKWQDGVDHCAHEHQIPVPVNKNEEQLYKCLDCGLISSGEDFAGVNILMPSVCTPKQIEKELEVLEHAE